MSKIKMTFCNRLKISIVSAGILLFGLKTHAQDPSIALLKTSTEIEDSYTLFTPEKNQSVYLVDNCGEKINEWTFTEKPGATCYLLENGNLLRAGKDSLEIRNWQNDLIWAYAMNNHGYLQHHDIEPLPNGNVLCVLTDVYSQNEMTAAGRNPLITDSEFKLDKIIELEPVGTSDANLVWEWKFIDHFIQDFDASKLNYGIVEDHPELLDLNYDNSFIFDYTHVNAIDYNPVLDQIILSPRHLSEVYIIDHSTTTAEAAGHSGGSSGKGGDFLWRWGNPQVYRQGTPEDQKIFFQHDSKWVPASYLDGGKVSVFNNDSDGTETFSSIHLIEPMIVENEYTMRNNIFLPIDFDWSWSGSIFGNTVLEGKKSGTHSLPNGNFVICENSLGQISEINKAGEHLWTYKNPTGTIVYNQFDDIQGLDNSLFRGEKYPSNYVGFVGQDLTPLGIIENENSISEVCINGIGVDTLVFDTFLIQNPVVDNLLVLEQSQNINFLKITDLSGKIIFSENIKKTESFKIFLPSSLYIVQIATEEAIFVNKIIVL